MKGTIIALKPIREIRVCQKETAKKKLERRAILLALPMEVTGKNISLAAKYVPQTVKIPQMAATTLIDQTFTPKMKKEKATKFIKRPSLPVLPG